MKKLYGKAKRLPSYKALADGVFPLEPDFVIYSSKINVYSGKLRILWKIR